jgi:hypothetical protein
MLAAIDIQKMLVATGRKWRERCDPSLRSSLLEIAETIDELVELMWNSNRHDGQYSEFCSTASIVVKNECYWSTDEHDTPPTSISVSLEVSDWTGWPHLTRDWTA